MGKKRRRKRCLFCGQLFLPEPRQKAKQYACSDPHCQGDLKNAKQLRWLSGNPDYFRGRYVKTRAWLSSRPGYLARYRQKHPEKVERDNAARKRRHLRAKNYRADIQVAKSLQKPIAKILAPILAAPQGADIQDSFLWQVVIISLFSATYLERAHADIQGPIASEAAPCYPPRHEFPEEVPLAAGPGP